MSYRPRFELRLTMLLRCSAKIRLIQACGWSVCALIPVPGPFA